MTPSGPSSPVSSKTCKREHVYSATEVQCPICKSAASNIWREKNKSKLLSYWKDRYANNKDTHIKKVIEWRKANYDHWLAKDRERIEKDRVRISGVRLEHRKRNREKNIWHGMITRCTDPRHNVYHRYGGRGISVCERWKDFDNFFTDMGPRPSARHSIDRRNNDGNYTPDNCYWATPEQQARNTSRNRFLSLNGKTQCMADWANELGITTSLLWTRINNLKWPLERALTTGPYKRSMSQRIEF